MTQKQNIRLALVFGLFFISLGGWLLHLRIHPPANNPSNFAPFIIGLISIIIVPWLFLFRRMIHPAYIINGMSVIIGVMMMAHFSLSKLAAPVGFGGIVLGTTLADIVVLLGKFMVGKALFDLQFTQLEQELPVKSRFVRYPNLGWWLVHLIAISGVYAAGVILL